MLTWNLARYINGMVYREGECLSTDQKPNNDANMMNGSKLIEMNTGKIFIYDAKNRLWREF